MQPRSMWWQVKELLRSSWTYTISSSFLSSSRTSDFEEWCLQFRCCAAGDHDGEENDGQKTTGRGAKPGGVGTSISGKQTSVLQDHRSSSARQLLRQGSSEGGAVGAGLCRSERQGSTADERGGGGSQTFGRSQWHRQQLLFLPGHDEGTRCFDCRLPPDREQHTAAEEEQHLAWLFPVSPPDEELVAWQWTIGIEHVCFLSHFEELGTTMSGQVVCMFPLSD